MPQTITLAPSYSILHLAYFLDAEPLKGSVSTSHSAGANTKRRYLRCLAGLQTLQSCEECACYLDTITVTIIITNGGPIVDVAVTLGVKTSRGFVGGIWSLQLGSV